MFSTELCGMNQASCLLYNFRLPFHNFSLPFLQLLASQESLNEMPVPSKFRNILRYVKRTIMQCWALSSAAALTILLIYWVYGGVLAFLLLCFTITGILYHSEDQLVYHPDQPSHSRIFIPIPSMLRLPYESIYVRSPDGTRIHLYLIKQPNEAFKTAPTIVFLHGNAGNMGHRLQNASGLYHSLNCNLLMVEYRGYGLSEGCPSEEGICMDARTAIDFILSRPDLNHQQIVVFGRSLGGAVAIDLAARPEYSSRIWCVVLENTFTSIPDMAAVVLRWDVLKELPFFIYKNKFLSWQKVSSITIPVLFIMGLRDAFVPPAMMNKLYQRCGSPHKQVVHFSAGTHNDTWMSPGYYTAISNFFRSAVDYFPTKIESRSNIKSV